MPCCENHSQEIGTDDFSTDKQEIAFGNGNGNGFHPAALMPFPAFGLENMPATQVFQHVFPPGGGTVKSGVDLLTFICTFRI
jgi:hypothetical protein